MTREQFEEAAAEEGRMRDAESVDPAEILPVLEALIATLEEAYDRAGNPYAGVGAWRETSEVRMARKLVAKLKGAKS
jgi:hypothetical protein